MDCRESNISFNIDWYSKNDAAITKTVKPFVAYFVGKSFKRMMALKPRLISPDKRCFFFCPISKKSAPVEWHRLS